MAKLLLFIALLIVSFIQAQFKPQELKNLTRDQANGFAKELATNSKTPWEFTKAAENTNGNYYIVNYASGDKTLKIILQHISRGRK